MDILLVESDHLIRDQVKVGLQQFPEFKVTWGESYPGINLLRMKKYSYVFLGIPSQDHDGLRLLRHMRSFDQQTDVIVVTTQRAARDLAKDKSRLGIYAFLTTPIDVIDYFRLISRLKARDEKRPTADAGAKGH
ncbi:MAG: response regulator [Planctomycetota bacterium]|jgi:DNA-binding NtrC family response regulator